MGLHDQNSILHVIDISSDENEFLVNTFKKLKSPGVVHENAIDKKMIQMLQAKYRSQTNDNVSILRLSDGLVFSCDTQNPQIKKDCNDKVFTGELFCRFVKSKRLNKTFTKVYVASPGLAISHNTSIFKTIKKNTPFSNRTNIKRNDIIIQSKQQSLQTEIKNDTFAALKAGTIPCSRRVILKDIGVEIQISRERNPSLATVIFHPINFQMTANKSPNNLSVSLASAVGGVFGTITENCSHQLYVHGIRALINGALVNDTACPNVLISSKNQNIQDELDLLLNLNHQDCLINTIKSLNLVTSLDIKPVNGIDLCKVLNISKTNQPVAPASEKSVFSTNNNAQMAGICRRQKICSNKFYKNAMQGAFTAFSYRYLKGIQTQNFNNAKNETKETEPIMLNAPNTLQTKRWFDALKQCNITPLCNANWFNHEVSVSSVRHASGTALFFTDDEGAIFAVAGNPPLPTTKTLQKKNDIQDKQTHALVLSAAHDKLLKKTNLRSAAMRLACIDTLCSMTPEFSPCHELLRSVWLFSEKSRLCKNMPKNYCEQMCILKQMIEMPQSVNYWATVPYFNF